jgi:hypothetical protein
VGILNALITFISNRIENTIEAIADLIESHKNIAFLIKVNSNK